MMQIQDTWKDGDIVSKNKLPLWQGGPVVAHGDPCTPIDTVTTKWYEQDENGDPVLGPTGPIYIDREVEEATIRGDQLRNLAIGTAIFNMYRAIAAEELNASYPDNPPSEAQITREAVYKYNNGQPKKYWNRDRLNSDGGFVYPDDPETPTINEQDEYYKGGNAYVGPVYAVLSAAPWTDLLTCPCDE